MVDGGAGVVRCLPPSCRWPALSPWRAPIDDYITAASAALDGGVVDSAIQDLAVFEDRLYLGFGDATANAGRVFPIPLRAFAQPEDAAPFDEPLVVGEEAIAHFRASADALYVPGVDATEDAFLGNVFVKVKGAPWVRRRAVPGGVHVHDVTEHRGELFACGSGATNADDWRRLAVHAYLWRSRDRGVTWSIVDASLNDDEPGDRRWTHLLSIGGLLLGFGYHAGSTGRLSGVLDGVWTEGAFEPLGVVTDAVVLGAWPFDADAGLLSVVRVDGARRYESRVLRAAANGRGDGGAAVGAQAPGALIGKTLLDAFSVAPGELLLLVADGDVFPRPARPTRVRLLHTRDLSTFSELLAADEPRWPTALAYWRAGLYVGLADGRVLRSVAP